jgi:hypothetical protein
MNKTKELCFFVETLVDEYTLTKKKLKASFFKYLQSENIDRKTINEFLETGTQNIELQISEIDGALLGDDPILKEAYSSFRKPDLREFKQMLSDIIEDAIKYKETKKVFRKPRPQSPEKLVRGLNILETPVTIEGKEYVPCSKTDIVGSNHIVFYNVKSQEITFFIGKNLSCKGSRIINYDHLLSGTKKLKKVSESLDSIVESNQFTLSTIISSLPNKTKSPPKIISSNFILLKTIR